MAAEIPGSTSEVLCRAAAQAGLYVVAGLTERAGSRVYNAAVLIDASGQVLKHRKINLLDIEQAVYGVDAQQLVIVDVELKPKKATGTEIAPMLRGKGYDGP